MGVRSVLLKKSYISPEFDFIRIQLEDTICASAETPFDDIIEDDNDDDV